MEIGNIVSEFGEPIILALFAPLLSPLIKLFDRSRHRTELRTKLEDLNLISAVENNLATDDRLYSKKLLHERMSEITKASPYAAELTGLYKQDLSNRFELSDFFTAIAIPFSMMVISILVSDGFDDIFWSVIFVLSALLSLVITRMLITPYYSNYLLTFVLEVFGSVVAITWVVVLVRLYASTLPP